MNGKKLIGLIFEVLMMTAPTIFKGPVRTAL
jgi:hypothetical protein